uniref:WD_REPEATS_REGION domain-containing protein n=1 Tax=Caenorhabditis japonica TaxID=281687 RepID=A0A8R1DMQ1_CAEJA
MLGPSTSLSGNNNSALQSSVLSDGVLLSHSQPTREELKKTFETREGVYRNVSLAEFSRPRPLPQYHMPTGIASSAASQMVAAGSAVRVSFLHLAARFPENTEVTASTSSVNVANRREPNRLTNRYEQEVDESWSDKICFNVGKELYVYSYKGTNTEADLSRPLDKRVYKGTCPTYHAFNQETASDRSCELIIGFSLGQLQIIDPLEKTTPSPVSRLYNEDRFIDKTAVTCIRWLPGEPNFFLASYVSGNIYVYDQRIAPSNSNSSSGSSQGPPWTLHKEGEKYAIYTWKTKHQRNPIWRWQIGDGSIHQFNFSGADARMMATVGHDGFLRVFNFHSQELVAMMKSYFGGLLTLSWSPDAKLIVTGGEDDLLTVYNVSEKRVVCRGQGHKSWVSQVQFDPYLCQTDEDLDGANGIAATTTLDDVNVTMRAGPVASASADLTTSSMHAAPTFSRCSLASFNTINGGPSGNGVCYRIGSVGHDTFLCLWDITEDMLVQANVRRHRNSTIIAPMTMLEIQTNSLGGGRLEDLQEVSPGGAGTLSSTDALTVPPNNTAPRPEKTKKKRFAKRALALAKFGNSASSNSNSTSSHKTGLSLNGSANSDGSKKPNPALISQISCCNETRMLGSNYCPGIRDVPIIEPLLCKKVSHDRLTVLEFREDCVVTACQEGFICTWGRPGRVPLKRDCVNSPGTVSPETVAKPSSTGAVNNMYGYEMMSNGGGLPPSRSSSSYSNNEQQLRSPNATSPSYRVGTASAFVYNRPTYAWQNAN